MCSDVRKKHKLFLDLIFGYDFKKKINFVTCEFPGFYIPVSCFISLYSNILDDCAVPCVWLFLVVIWNLYLKTTSNFSLLFTCSYPNRREREKRTRKPSWYIFIPSTIHLGTWFTGSGAASVNPVSHGSWGLSWRIPPQVAPVSALCYLTAFTFSPPLLFSLFLPQSHYKTLFCKTKHYFIYGWEIQRGPID